MMSEEEEGGDRSVAWRTRRRWSQRTRGGVEEGGGRTVTWTRDDSRRSRGGVEEVVVRGPRRRGRGSPATRRRQSSMPEEEEGSGRSAAWRMRRRWFRPTHSGVEEARRSGSRLGFGRGNGQVSFYIL